MHIELRIAKESDVSLLAELGAQTFYDTFHEQNKPEDMDVFLRTYFTDAAVAKELNNPFNTFIIAQIRAEPVGYLKIIQLPNTSDGEGTLEISQLYVVKEQIGKGVGNRLMQYCIDLAKEQKKTAIWLGVWEHNQKAIAFYTRFGFEKVGEHIFMLGSDKQNDWLMKKIL